MGGVVLPDAEHGGRAGYGGTDALPRDVRLGQTGGVWYERRVFGQGGEEGAVDVAGHGREVAVPAVGRGENGPFAAGLADAHETHGVNSPVR
ncbi:hypothetical protein AB0O76_40230 [Streptomyces sp. NPDC086554]|uniref:hypothetical protein n=1 Tax=Streptomyces sp. NPDC086554 TaxID=3154864 RepID=UPI00342E8B7F